jgi:hypothetical protein|tara:strand:- start:370 stop:555 length:186 start_codon:yes stop_codon:yes gene_type:complete
MMRKKLNWEIKTMEYLLESLEKKHLKNNIEDWSRENFIPNQKINYDLKSVINKLKLILKMY